MDGISLCGEKILVSKANWYPFPPDGKMRLHSGTVCFTKHILYILVLLGYGLGIPGRECVNKLERVPCRRL